MTKTRRKVEWEIPQGKNPRIKIIVREAGSLGTTSVNLSVAELAQSLNLLEYVTAKRANTK